MSNGPLDFEYDFDAEPPHVTQKFPLCMLEWLVRGIGKDESPVVREAHYWAHCDKDDV